MQLPKLLLAMSANESRIGRCNFWCRKAVARHGLFCVGSDNSKKLEADIASGSANSLFRKSRASGMAWLCDGQKCRPFRTVALVWT